MGRKSGPSNQVTPIRMTFFILFLYVFPEACELWLSVYVDPQEGSMSTINSDLVCFGRNFELLQASKMNPISGFLYGVSDLLFNF